MLCSVSTSQKGLNRLSLPISYFIELLNLFLLYYQRVICIHRSLTKIGTSVFMAVIIDFCQKLKDFCEKKSNSAQKVSWVVETKQRS